MSDTSPIRALAHLSLLRVLKELFGQIIVPPAVDAELRVPAAGFMPVDVRMLDFVSLQAPRDTKRVQTLLKTLDPGESEALVLALELGSVAILIDERAGREMAKQLGLMPIGVLGTLVRAEAARVDRLGRAKNRSTRAGTWVLHFSVVTGADPEVRGRTLKRLGGRHSR